MIESSVSIGAGAAEFAAARRQFYFAPLPSGAPFAPQEAAAVVRSDAHFGVEFFGSEAAHSMDRDAQRILNDIAERVRRDVHRHPSSPIALTNLGLALLNQGDLDGAAASFAQVLQMDPASYVALASLARIEARRGRTKEARALYGRLLSIKANDVTGLLGMAYIQRIEGDLLGARETLASALRSEPESVAVRHQLGLVLLGEGKVREALAHLKAASNLDVRSSAVHHALGVAYSMIGDRKRGARAFQAALALEPERIDSVHGLATAFLREGRAELAADLLREQLGRRKEPFTGQDAETRHLLAIAYFRSGRFEAAKTQLTHGLKDLALLGGRDPETEARFLNNLGLCQMRTGEVKQAEASFLGAIEASPRGSAIPYHNLGGHYVSQDRTSEAIDVFRSCAAQFPDDAESRWHLAVLMADSGQADAAISELREFVASGKASPEVFSVLGGLLADEKEMLDEAVSILQDAFRRFPGSTRVANNLAYVHLLRREPEAARVVLDAVSDDEVLEQDLPVWTATHGLLKLLEGDIDGGTALYRKAALLATNEGRRRLARQIRQKMHLELGKLYQAAGDLDKASAEIRSGLSLDGKLAYRRALLELSGEVAQ